MQIIIYPLFALVIFLYVAFLKLGVGLPVRTLVLCGVFGMLIAFHKRHVQFFIAKHAHVVAVFLYIAVLGASLTLAQGGSVGDLITHLLRQIVQPFMLLVSTYVMCQLAGVIATSSILFVTAAMTVAVAVAQYLGLDAAWQLREAIGAIQDEPALTRAFVRSQTRVMGLSFSPIELSYHLASLYVLSFLLFKADLIRTKTYYVLIAVIFCGAIIIETRSLLLGIVVHEFIRILSEGKIRKHIALVLLVGLGYFAFNYASSIDSRIVSVEDQSASGRRVLYLFGLRLFLDNLTGFGWGFSAQDYAWLYWEHLTEFGKPEIVYRLNLHNAFLLYLLVYGVLGLIPVVYLLLVRFRETLLFILFFMSYLIHAFFHNKGIFLVAQLVWFVVAVFLYLKDQKRLIITFQGRKSVSPARLDH